MTSAQKKSLRFSSFPYFPPPFLPLHYFNAFSLSFSKGSKVYKCDLCGMVAHGAPKKCYEKASKTCGMNPEMQYLVRAGRQLLRTAAAEHRVVHTNEQYDGVATVNKFSKEVQEKKKSDVFIFNDVILILWESNSHLASSSYEFCTLFYYFNPVLKEPAQVRSMTPTLLEVRPPSGDVLHSLLFESEDETSGVLKTLEDRIRDCAPGEAKEMDEHGSEIDKSRPVWFTLPSTCPVPDGSGGSFMAYIVNIKFRDSGQEQVVLKRYNQFWILHQKLKVFFLSLSLSLFLSFSLSLFLSFSLSLFLSFSLSLFLSFSLSLFLSFSLSLFLSFSLSLSISSATLSFFHIFFF